VNPFLKKAGVAALALGKKKWNEENERRRRQGQPSIQEALVEAAKVALKAARDGGKKPR
jgi:hypothetical protein